MIGNNGRKVSPWASLRTSIVFPSIVSSARSLMHFFFPHDLGYNKELRK